MPVWWHDVGVRGGDAAFDSETRDAGTSVARARVARLARHMIGAELAYKKIDSCLRGQPAAEIAATNREGRFRTVVVAPAFPAQGRVTRQGRQLVRDGDGWRDTGVDIARELAAEGLMARHGTPGPGGGVFVCDADQDADLAEIAASPGLSPPVLWCGSGGLARALAGPAAYLPVADALPPPTLLVVGTAHPATLAQLAWLDKLPSDIRIARVDLPPGSPASHARAALEQLTASLADSRASWLCTGDRRGDDDVARHRAGRPVAARGGRVGPGHRRRRLRRRPVARPASGFALGGFGAPDVLAALLGMTARA